MVTHDTQRPVAECSHEPKVRQVGGGDPGETAEIVSDDHRQGEGRPLTRLAHVRIQSRVRNSESAREFCSRVFQSALSLSRIDQSRTISVLMASLQESSLPIRSAAIWPRRLQKRAPRPAHA
jgi:hypothetical protein